MRNKYGANGHPCLTPHSILKDTPGVPLRLTAADALTNRRLTHLMHVELILSFLIALNKKIHDTLSYAFEKSSFRKTVGCLDTFAHCRDSSVNTMLSNINLRGRKAVCSGLIASLSIGCSRNCRVLAKIL